MLINVKFNLRVGDTMVPLIFMSDRRHLLNFAGDKKVWPIYMTIRNLSAKVGQMPSTHTIVLVTLFPVSIQNHNIPLMRLEVQRQRN